MEKKKVLVGFSGNLEVTYVEPEELQDKKYLLKEGDDEWGIGGTSVDVAIAMKFLRAPAFIQLLLNVGAAQNDFRRDELAHYLDQSGINHHFFRVLTGTNRAIIRRCGKRTTIAGRKHKYVDENPSTEALVDYAVAFQPDLCIATGGMPSDVPYTMTMFKHGRYNVLNPRKDLVMAKQLIKEVLAETTLLQINSSEMMALLGRMLTNGCPTRNDFLEVHNMGPREIIVTLSENGSIYSSVDDGMYHQDSYPVENPRDKTGAGDSFLAGFLTKRLEEASVAEAMDFAARVAAVKIKKATGARMPTRDEVDGVD